MPSAVAEQVREEAGGEAAEDEHPLVGHLPWPLSPSGAVALVVGLLVTAGLALTALAVYNRNEQRLLNLRVRELGLVLQSAASTIQTPLTAAAALTSATAENPAKFRGFMMPLVGAGRQFSSAGLWRAGATAPKRATLVGVAPSLSHHPADAQPLIARAGRPGTLSLIGILSAREPSIAYAVGVPGQPGLVVFAESRLPASRRSKLEKNNAFSELDYAVFLGKSRRSANLLLTSAKSLPIRGRQAVDTVRFGDGDVTVVITPRTPLGGTFFRDLPWIVGGLGLLLTIAAATLTERLARGRKRAERLAGVLDRVAEENRRMYTEQRSIAQTLQHALLPEALPELRGLDVDALYVPAASGVDVGGDWYDVVELDGRHVLAVIGDVSGHGLKAATTMAMVRHATLAYVAQNHRPAEVLGRLSEFVNRTEHDYFATVLCALIDVDEHRVTVASAGHMAPLMLSDGGGEFLRVETGAPIGVAWASAFQETTASVPPGGTLIAFTDGLVERRGEPLDAGLARLRDLARAQPRPLEALLAKLAHDLVVGDLHDDTAMVGIQWQS
jgi:serine phosphatase RsbU (regulator of sigma subunit)